MWEGTGEAGWRRWLGPVATVAITCLLLALSFALQYGLAAAAAHQSDGRCAARRTCACGWRERCTVRTPSALSLVRGAMFTESIARRAVCLHAWT